MTVCAPRNPPPPPPPPFATPPPPSAGPLAFWQACARRWSTLSRDEADADLGRRLDKRLFGPDGRGGSAATGGRPHELQYFDGGVLQQMRHVPRGYQRAIKAHAVPTFKLRDD